MAKSGPSHQDKPEEHSQFQPRETGQPSQAASNPSWQRPQPPAHAPDNRSKPPSNGEIKQQSAEHYEEHSQIQPKETGPHERQQEKGIKGYAKKSLSAIKSFFKPKKDDAKSDPAPEIQPILPGEPSPAEKRRPMRQEIYGGITMEELVNSDWSKPPTYEPAQVYRDTIARIRRLNSWGANPDWSRLDFLAARDMLKTHNAAFVEEAIRKGAPRPERKNHQWDDYAKRTTAAALKVSKGRGLGL